MYSLPLGLLISAIVHFLIIASILFLSAIEKKPAPVEMIFNISPAQFIEEKATITQPKERVQVKQEKVVKSKKVEKPSVRNKSKELVKKNKPKKKPIEKTFNKVKALPPVKNTSGKAEEKEDKEASKEKAKPVSALKSEKTVSKKTSKPQESARKSADPNLKAKYTSKIARLIKSHKYYPIKARKFGVEGKAEVSFTVSKNGSVSNIRIVKGSGSDLLDEAAKKAVLKAAKRFPAIPSDLNQTSISITVPLEYILR